MLGVEAFMPNAVKLKTVAEGDVLQGVRNCARACEKQCCGDGAAAMETLKHWL